MSHRQQYATDIPPYVGESGEVGDLPEGEEDEAMEIMDDQGYASSTPTSSSTWISWFCSLPGHEYFCEVAEDFIEDDFNLTGLNALVPFWKEAMEIVLDVEPEDALKIPDMSIVESSAELLYGLVHQRYILTRPGLQAMVEKYEAGHFGTCPRVYCQSNHVAPAGRSDLPGLDTVKLYCPNCNDIYTPPSSRYQSVDGAFFGTTFAPLLFQTYREIAPAPFCPPPSHRNRAGLSSDPTVLDESAAGSAVHDIDDDELSSSESAAQLAFVNPNPHGGKKKPAGRVYEARLFGFRVHEKARSGPRMKWLRMRPESLDDLDRVDWQGRWKRDGDEFDADGEDDEDEDGRGGRRMENFDDDLGDGKDDPDEDEEEEEEDGAHPGGGGGQGGPSIPYPPGAPRGKFGRARAAIAPRPFGAEDDEVSEAEEEQQSGAEESSSDSSSLITPDDRPLRSPPTTTSAKQAIAPVGQTKMTVGLAQTSSTMLMM